MTGHTQSNSTSGAPQGLIAEGYPATFDGEDEEGKRRLRPNPHAVALADAAIAAALDRLSS